MKKIVVFLCIALASASAKAQSEKNAVKLNPLSLIFSTGNVSYERVIGAKTSIQLGIFYTGMKFSDLKYSGIGITPEVRFYIGKKEVLNGTYVAPFLRYQNFKLKDELTESKATFTSFGGGAVFGWQKVWRSGFLLNLFAGPAYNSGKIKMDDEDDESFSIKAGVDGFGIRTGIALGYAF